MKNGKNFVKIILAKAVFIFRKKAIVFSIGVLLVFLIFLSVITILGWFGSSTAKEIGKSLNRGDEPGGCSGVFIVIMTLVMLLLVGATALLKFMGGR